VINLNEETARIKKIMGITEDENISEVEEIETDEVVEGEIDEEDEGGDSAPSSMSKWDSGVQRGKGNPIETGSKWESGLQRGKGNPIW
jgi:hypothetical protein